MTGNGVNACRCSKDQWELAGNDRTSLTDILVLLKKKTRDANAGIVFSLTSRPQGMLTDRPSEDNISLHHSQNPLTAPKVAAIYVKVV